jgi:hypothetical protein
MAVLCWSSLALQQLQMDPNRERFRQDPNDIFTSSIKKSVKPSKPGTSRSSQPEASWVLSAFPVDQHTMEPLVTELPELPLNYDAQIQTVLPAWAAEVRKCDTCFSVSGQLPRSTQLHGPHIAGRAAFSIIRMKKGNKSVVLQAGDVVKLPLSGAAAICGWSTPLKRSSSAAAQGMAMAAGAASRALTTHTSAAPSMVRWVFRTHSAAW